MADEERVEYAPAWAGAHVAGSYTRLTRGEDGEPEEQTVRASCSACGAELGPLKCRSGMPRHHVDTFARVHLHRHPLADLPRKP